MVVITTVLGMIPLLEGPVLRRDGRVHHVRPVVRRVLVADRDAGAVRDLLRHSRAGTGIRGGEDEAVVTAAQLRVTDSVR